jgi:hypothetical protein
MQPKVSDLGAQDPEARNSPVAWETDEDMETLREAVPGEPICYFNGQAYEHDTVIKSGAVLLRCDHGLWVPAGSSDTDNP